MNLRENNSRSKEILGAYLRQGMHELGAALYPPGTAAQHSEYGMIGTKPPSMVVDGLKGENAGNVWRNDTAPSQLDPYLQRGNEHSAPSREPEREDPNIERA